jgi:hypothetical protein
MYNCSLPILAACKQDLRDSCVSVAATAAAGCLQACMGPHTHWMQPLWGAELLAGCAVTSDWTALGWQ